MMDKKDLIDIMFRDIDNWDVEEGEGGEEDFILSGKGWNLYKDGERKYRLHDCNDGEDYAIDDSADIEALEQHLKD
jgi:hypothetical protein